MVIDWVGVLITTFTTTAAWAHSEQLDPRAFLAVLAQGREADLGEERRVS